MSTAGWFGACSCSGICCPGLFHLKVYADFLVHTPNLWVTCLQPTHAPQLRLSPTRAVSPTSGTSSLPWPSSSSLLRAMVVVGCMVGGLAATTFCAADNVRSDRLQDQLNLRMREILDLQGKWNSCSNRSKNLLCLLAQSSPTERSRSSNRKCETWSRASGTRTGSCEPWIESA